MGPTSTLRDPRYMLETVIDLASTLKYPEAEKARVTASKLLAISESAIQNYMSDFEAKYTLEDVYRLATGMLNLRSNKTYTKNQIDRHVFRHVLPSFPDTSELR